MTNLQDGASRLSGATLRRLWLLVPAVALGGVGVLVFLAGTLPLWSSLQRDSQRLQELEQLRDQVTLMQTQLATSRENIQKAQDSKAKIVRLITGNGDLSTFLAMLDREAKSTGVQLDLYEPTGAAGPSGSPAPGAPPSSAPPAAGSPPAQGGAARPAGTAPSATPPAPGGAAAKPLAMEGLSQRSLLLSARGDFPSLLAFLRRLEALNVLVVQSDLSLTLAEEPAKSGTPPKAEAPVVMKLALGLYSRDSGGVAAAGAPAPPGAAGTSPPPAPSGGAPPAPAPAPAPASPTAPN
ncbi:MAG: hypothetical protein ER33_09750 [Cyanobium sp. CACIAM 14]|nr:MAG: hypothetical protein ER33_09750 [Cyanobium sp. CACIAM 14]